MRPLYLITFIALISTAIISLIISHLGSFEYVSGALRSIVAYSDGVAASREGLQRYSKIFREHRDSAEDICDYLSVVRCFRKDGYNTTYYVYDVPTFQCTCSLRPSEFLVSQHNAIEALH